MNVYLMVMKSKYDLWTILGVANVITTKASGMPYAEGAANTGLIPVNINSTRAALIQAYPWKAAGFRQLPENYNLRTLQGVYYKR